MRLCVRCQTEMVEGCKLRESRQGYDVGIINTRAGGFAPSLGKTRVAVCPQCGEVSIYIENPGSLLAENGPGSIYD